MQVYYDRFYNLSQVISNSEDLSIKRTDSKQLINHDAREFYLHT
jgi:hypothetical protein